MIDLNQTVGRVATEYPSSIRVFLRHRIDFCCGGGQRLAEACRKASLDPRQLIEEIEGESKTRAPVRWDTKSAEQLIDFIVAEYHAALRVDLPALLEAARRVERVHGKKASCPIGLADLVARLAEELEEHMTKEEQILFPAIAARRSVQAPVNVMMREHDDHGDHLRALRVLATDYLPPPEACATWRALYAGLAKLEADLMEHIHLENNVLFPRASAP